MPRDILVYNTTGPTATITMTAMSTATTATNNCRQGNMLDFGATRGDLWLATINAAFVTAPTSGGTVELYMSWSSSSATASNFPGGCTGVDGFYTGGSATPAEGLRHLEFIGALSAAATLSTVRQTQDLPPTLPDPGGSRVSQAGPAGTTVLWDLEGFPDAQPLAFGRPGPASQPAPAYDPSGGWLARGDVSRTTIELWPVSGPWRRVLPSSRTPYHLAFTPDGRWLATCPNSRPVGLWPLKALDGPPRSLAEGCVTFAIDPTGRQVLVGTLNRGVALYPFQGGAPRRLSEAGAKWYNVAFDPEGWRAVAVPGDGFPSFQEPASRVLRVWDLPSGKEQVHSVAHLTAAEWLGWRSEFAPDGRIYTGGQGGARRLTLPSEPGGGHHEHIVTTLLTVPFTFEANGAGTDTEKQPDRWTGTTAKYVWG